MFKNSVNIFRFYNVKPQMKNALSVGFVGTNLKFSSIKSKNCD